MFTSKVCKNYVVKMSLDDFDEDYHIFIKGTEKELTVGLWNIVYDDNDLAIDKIYDISEMSTEDLKTLDINSLVDQGYKILF